MAAEFYCNSKHLFFCKTVWWIIFPVIVEVLSHHYLWFTLTRVCQSHWEWEDPAITSPRAHSVSWVLLVCSHLSIRFILFVAHYHTEMSQHKMRFKSLLLPWLTRPKVPTNWLTEQRKTFQLHFENARSTGTFTFRGHRLLGAVFTLTSNQSSLVTFVTINSLVGSTQREHSVLKAMVMHDQARSPHGWVTISC